MWRMFVIVNIFLILLKEYSSVSGKMRWWRCWILLFCYGHQISWKDQPQQYVRLSLDTSVPCLALSPKLIGSYWGHKPLKTAHKCVVSFIFKKAQYFPNKAVFCSFKRNIDFDLCQKTRGTTCNTGPWPESNQGCCTHVVWAPTLQPLGCPQ